MGNERELAQNYLNAAIAFNDAQEAEYAAGEPAFSEAANARTLAAASALADAGSRIAALGLEPNREMLLRAGLADYEIDFIAVQMVQVPFEATSNSDTVGSRASSERLARFVGSILTQSPEDNAASSLLQKMNGPLPAVLEAELRGAKLLAPSDSVVNTNPAIAATQGNTLERQTLVEPTPGPRIG